jgi:bla regulator protein blaR1
MNLADLSPLANHLWQSTLFAIVAWLLTLALRNNRAAVRYWIWLAASIKFLIPFSLLIEAGSLVSWRTAPALQQPRVSLVVDAISRPFVSSASSTSPAVIQATSGVPAILLLSVWFLGSAIGVFWWLRRWRHIRAAQRSATPLDLNLPIPVMSSAGRLEPGVFGIRKPVLLLPGGIISRLTPAQLQAVLAHELCHLHRRDNLTAAIHMAIETIFWFHPLVWWIRARLVEERERACDDEVLSVISDARVYAEGILNVCKFYLESPLVCVAGVTGSNLKRRIEEIMEHRVVRNLDFGRKVLLAAAGLAAVGVPIVIGMTDALPLRAQSKPGERLAFEVASVKHNTSTDPRGVGMQVLPGGRFVASAPLFAYVAVAYDLPIQSERLTGGPDWFRTERYDIEATPGQGAIPAGATVKERNDKLHLMLQTLLAERFKMVIRREIRELPAYAVTVKKGGPKLQKAAVAEKDCSETTKSAQDPASCHTFSGGQGQGIHAQAVSMSDLAFYASGWADHAVIDKTGLKGLYNIQTEGWVPMRPRPVRPVGQDPSAEDLAFADPARPTFFQIFDRLGLKLESQKLPVEMIVVESAERPPEN